MYQCGELLLCVDEKTSIQALQRKYPGKPVRPGSPELREFEYIRHGTRCLIATLLVATGRVFGDVSDQRTKADYCAHIERVASELLRQYPQTRRFHWVMDNLNTHWSLELCRLFARLSRVKYEPKELKKGKQRRAFLTDPSHTHVIPYRPKHGSWLNQIELWFSVLARRVLRRGDFHSKEEVTEKILAYIDYYNTYRAHPYRWTYTGKPLVT